MNTRRNFLRNTAALAAGSLLTKGLDAQSLFSGAPAMNRFGVGLFTVPKMLNDDFAGTLKMIAGIGYKEVEFFGPYSFSTQADIEGWKAAGKSLGFSGSGFFGNSITDVKKILADNGLTAPSMHTSLPTLKEKMGELADAANAIGAKYLVLPSAQTPADLNGYKRQADEYNAIGAAAAKHGLRFAYHNHGNGLKAIGGKIPMELVIESTDPKTVFFQMDLFWTVAGGIDPVQFLKKYSGRYVSLHIKDMSKDVRFSGDGGDMGQWMALFPHLTDAGSGVLPLKAMLAQAQQSGVQHFFVERDLAPDAKQALTNAYRFLNGLQVSA